MSVAFAIDTQAVEKSTLEALESRFAVVRQARPAQSIVFYDSFDWRLFRKGTTLTGLEQDGRADLCWRSRDGRLLHRLVLEAIPAFARELPGGVFRDSLESILEMRRLLPVVRLQLRGRRLRILDRERKTVARAAFERGYASSPDTPDKRRRLNSTLSVIPVKGYEKSTEQVLGFIERKVGLRPVEPCTLTRALEAIGVEPAAVRTRLRLQLDPELTASAAVRSILLELLALMRLNEDGLRRDLDSEFLHDFRVSVRRTRSLLGQIKQVFPRERIAPFRTEFKWLGALTGPTRDMDVYLLKMPSYRTLLPEELREDLAPLEEFLRRQQQIEHERLVTGLDSDRYGRLLREWAEFLRDAPEETEDAPDALRPVTDVASERIRRSLRKVLKLGGKIGPESPAQRLHRLRIECKKLRYLLEFFSSLYDAKRIDRLIKELKKLQDHLGDFNDLEVQREKLQGFAGNMAGGGVTRETTLLAMGRLVERLEVEQARERERFERRFARFSTASHRQLARKLFASEESAV